MQHVVADVKDKFLPFVLPVLSEVTSFMNGTPAPLYMYCTHSCSVLFIMNDLLSYPFSSQFSDAVRVRPSRQATPAFRSVPQFSVIDLRCSRCCRWEAHQSVRVPLCLSDLLIGDQEGLVLVSHE